MKSAKGQVARNKKRKPIIADFHIHTVASGHAYSTILEYAKEAKKRKLKYIAITDHGPAMPDGPHYYYFCNLQMLPLEVDGVKILRGIEANIINNDGALDLDNEIFDRIHFVLATFHPRCGYENQGEEKNTDTIVKAMNNPHLCAIAHPENAQFPVDFKRLAEAAKEKDILIEVNNSSYLSRPGTKDRIVQILKEVKRVGGNICLGTDSHIATMVGKFDYALTICREVDFPVENIINYSEELIKKYIKPVKTAESPKLMACKNQGIDQCNQHHLVHKVV